MTPSARVSAAIEILAELDVRMRPATDALKAWGLSHRFAGSGDRAAIASLVYDALRRKSSSTWLMGEATPRAVLLGSLKLARGLETVAIEKLFDGSRFAPDPLSKNEHSRLIAETLDDAPAYIRGDYPQWLDAELAKTFGDERAKEGAAAASRAPLDLRTNLLRTTRENLLSELSHLNAVEMSWSSFGVRIPLDLHGRHPPVTSEPSFQKGWFEVQDEGSQIAAQLADAKPGDQVLDLCAGSGGKTLALAAIMENRGQIFAYDGDLRRLAPIHDRIKRADAHNIQVRSPKGKTDVLADLAGRMDIVLLDAPCTGTGVWRRHPDAKWRIRPGALEVRVKEQSQLLDEAVRFVRPGGRVVYITCSMLDVENGSQIRELLARTKGWSLVAVTDVCSSLGERGHVLRAAAHITKEGLLLTPRRTNTDGFFISVLRQDQHG